MEYLKKVIQPMRWNGWDSSISVGALGHTYLSVKVIFKKYLRRLKNLGSI